jgi:hypothetical protein
MKRKYTFGDNIALGVFTLVYGVDVVVWEKNAETGVITSTLYASCKPLTSERYGRALNVLMTTITDGDGHKTQHFDFVVQHEHTKYITGTLPNELVRDVADPRVTSDGKWRLVTAILATEVNYYSCLME